MYRVKVAWTDDAFGEFICEDAQLQDGVMVLHSSRSVHRKEVVLMHCLPLDNCYSVSVQEEEQK